jgi:hypothetical protein
MKPKLILCLALVLSGGLFGCSSIDHPSANSRPSQPDLYLHIIADYADTKPLQTLLSARIRLSTDFDLLMADGQRLKGRIEPRNGKFFVAFRADYFGTNVFKEAVEFNEVKILELEPLQFFVLSANSSSKSALKQVADFLPVETLTARQLAEVKKNFHLMRPGMTEDEVFSMLGLAGYQHRLFPANFSRSNDWGISDYQLADNERLSLFLDNTGMKTMKVQLPDEDKLEVWDYDNSHVTNRLVIKAELDTMASLSNSPSMWRSVLKWP